MSIIDLKHIQTLENIEIHSEIWKWNFFELCACFLICLLEFSVFISFYKAVWQSKTAHFDYTK